MNKDRILVTDEQWGRCSWARDVPRAPPPANRACRSKPCSSGPCPTKGRPCSDAQGRICALALSGDYAMLADRAKDAGYLRA